MVGPGNAVMPLKIEQLSAMCKKIGPPPVSFMSSYKISAEFLTHLIRYIPVVSDDREVEQAIGKHLSAADIMNDQVAPAVG